MNPTVPVARVATLPAGSALRGLWLARSAREQVLVVLALILVAGAVLWWGALGPALRTVAGVPAQLAQLDGQLARMKSQAEEAARIRQLAVPTRLQAQAALESGLRPSLGAGASLQLQNDRATISLKAVPPENLAPWLAQLRPSLGAVVEQLELRRAAEGWDGTIVLLLPAGQR